MRISNLLWMAIKTLKGKLIALPVAAIAISTFCLCFAGAVMVTVEQEKSLPYELELVSDTATISDSIVAKISATPDVTAVTPVLDVPVIVEAGGYKARLNLTGIHAAYIEDAFVCGGAFPDNTVMPYIILNKAACKLFKDENGGDENAEQADAPQIDWLNTAVSIKTSDGTKPVVSKIVGLLAGDDENQEPAAYIGMASAKDMLRRDGQSTDYVSVDVRVKNAGCAASVSGQINALGLSVVNANENAQMDWDAKLSEMTYLIIIGILGLLFAALLSNARRKTQIREQQYTYAALQWIGMKEKDLRRADIIQSMVTALLGVVIGIIVCVSVPSFISPEDQGTTIFFLQTPFAVIATCTVMCIVAYVVPNCIWRMSLSGQI